VRENLLSDYILAWNHVLLREGVFHDVTAVNNVLKSGTVLKEILVDRRNRGVCLWLHDCVRLVKPEFYCV